MRGQKLLPTLFDGLIWRSRLTRNKKRRVNFFVQHLIQNGDGTFNTYLPALVKLHDPNLIGHPVVSFVFNLLWAHLARYGFLRSRLAYLFLVVLVVVSQSILPRLNPGDETPAQRIALFVCRVALYLFLVGGFSLHFLFVSILFKDDYIFLLTGIFWGWVRTNQPRFDFVPHLLHIIWQLVRDIRARSFIFLWGTLPIPTYLGSLSHAALSVVTICMLLMLIQEPIFACLGNMDGAFPGAGSFTTHCPEAQARMNAYSVLSEITVLLHWLLVTDLCIFSIRLCCYFLTCTWVLVELLHYCIAVLFLILAFSSAIGAYGTMLFDFDSIPDGALSLFKIALRVYENQRFDSVREEPQIYTMLVVFTLVSLIFLGSLLIAQIAGAFTKLYADIGNYAILFRAGITVETVRSVRPKRWAAFLSGLKFQEKIEFNEGDWRV